jgi:L-threonylcarbamoyladenylate synthase
VPQVLPVDAQSPDEDVLRQASEALLAGYLIIYPTDTLYALGGVALCPGVSRRVAAAKGRQEGKPLPLVAADVGQVRSLVRDWPELANRLAERFWPGPLTLVLEAPASIPEEVTAGTGTVAVRVPALALVRALCLRSGPLFATSANVAGEPAPLTCDAAMAGVGDAAFLALDAGPGQPLPSTIVDVRGSAPVLIREGAVAWSAVLAAIDFPSS